MSVKEKDEFGTLAVALGFMTRAQLKEASDEQARIGKEGTKVRLGEVCLKSRFLRRHQVLLVLRAQGKRILTCRACKKSFNVHKFRTDETYTCKHCKDPLTVPTRAIPFEVKDSVVGASTEVVPPGRMKIPPDLARLLPGYEIVERLGQGGMGTVYKARDKILDRWVAVKILAPFLAANQSYVDRFFTEARTMGKLKHPHIVQAYDAGEAGEHKFFLMEFVDGPSLDKAIHKNGKLRERSALKIVRDIGHALDYSWRRGILHRDVKPQNIMLKGRKIPKLCDLGLSKDIESDLSFTVTGSINCSPPYASPEQAQGVKDLDCRSDTYSLGVTFFQMVTGKLPFEGEAPGSFLIQHVTKRPPDPRALNENLSQRAARLILRMLEKDPDNRPTPGAAADSVSKLIKAKKPGK